MAARGVSGRDDFHRRPCFAALEDVPRWFDPAPRFGAIYDLFADGRSAIKLGVSRYNIGTASGHSSRVNPNRVTNDTRPWVDLPTAT